MPRKDTIPISHLQAVDMNCAWPEVGIYAGDRLLILSERVGNGQLISARFKGKPYILKLIKRTKTDVTVADRKGKEYTVKRDELEIEGRVYLPSRKPIDTSGMVEVTKRERKSKAMRLIENHYNALNPRLSIQNGQLVITIEQGSVQ